MSATSAGVLSRLDVAGRFQDVGYRLGIEGADRTPTFSQGLDSVLQAVVEPGLELLGVLNGCDILAYAKQYRTVYLCKNQRVTVRMYS